MHISLETINKDIIGSLNSSCVVFDLETTGLSPEKDRIVEFAAIKLKDGVVVDTLTFLVNPGILIPERVVAINHITNEMVANKPKEDYYLKDIMNFFSGVNIISGHNVKFDLSFLDAMLARSGVTFDCNYLDTLTLARKYLPGMINYKLGTLAEYLGLSTEGAHRALFDVELTIELLKHIASVAMKNQ